MTAWEHYKKTFVATQVVIAAVAVAVYAWCHVPGIAMMFFVTMQSAALVGSAWAARLRKKVLRDAGLVLPTR